LYGGSLVRWPLLALLAGGCIEPMSADDIGVVRAESSFRDAKVTYYTLVTEQETMGDRTGGYREVCNQYGLTGCYSAEFLCSKYGVVMQGTGIDRNGRYIKLMNPGQVSWASTNPYSTWADCSRARFAVVDQVTGSTGLPLVENFSVAATPEVASPGSYIWLSSECRWFRVDDFGPAMRATWQQQGRAHVDIFRGRSREPLAANTSGQMYVTLVPHASTDAPPPGFTCTGGQGAGPSSGSGTGSELVCPSNHTDCMNGKCCPSTFPICCSDNQSCGSSQEACGNPQSAQDCSIDCGDGSCCPASLMYCCPNGSCSPACGPPSPAASDPQAACPAGYPVDCQNGACCPSDYPACCMNGRCATSQDACGTEF
jgi:hypothetical protein